MNVTIETDINGTKYMIDLSAQFTRDGKEIYVDDYTIDNVYIRLGDFRHYSYTQAPVAQLLNDLTFCNQFELDEKFRELIAEKIYNKLQARY